MKHPVFFLVAQRTETLMSQKTQKKSSSRQCFDNEGMLSFFISSVFARIELVVIENRMWNLCCSVGIMLPTICILIKLMKRMISSDYVLCATERILVSCLFTEWSANIRVTFSGTRIRVYLFSASFLRALLLLIRVEWTYVRCIRFVLAVKMDCLTSMQTEC